jgi:hypothetical protein
MADVGRHWIYAVLMGTNQYCMHTEHRQRKCFHLIYNNNIIIILSVIQTLMIVSTTSHTQKKTLSQKVVSSSVVPHMYPLSFISFSMVRLHVVFGLPLFLFPSGVHLRATFVMSSDGCGAE